MKYKTAKMSLAIKVITAMVIMMSLGFLIGGIYLKDLWVGGITLGIIVFLCYLWAPVGYEISDRNLKVIYRWGDKDFPKITKCSLVKEKLGFGVRLFGNGGVFCGSGIFWCTRLGTFRAYVTSARREDFVLIETEAHKIIISPENRDEFIEE